MAACGNCGAENIADAKYCNGCGSKLPEVKLAARICRCGTVNPGTASFCSACGNKLLATPERKRSGRPPDEKSLAERPVIGVEIGMSRAQRRALNFAKERAGDSDLIEYRGVKGSLNTFTAVALQTFCANDLGIDFNNNTANPNFSPASRPPLCNPPEKPQAPVDEKIRWYQARLTKKQFGALAHAYDLTELDNGPRYRHITSKNQLVLAALRQLLANDNLRIDFDAAFDLKNNETVATSYD